MDSEHNLSHIVKEEEITQLSIEQSVSLGGGKAGNIVNRQHEAFECNSK